MITICLPIGGGTVDIENVVDPTAYYAKGYYQCGDGTTTNTGYCISDKSGVSCEPAPVTATPQSLAMPPAHTLPDVGATSDIAIALIIAVIGTGIWHYVTTSHKARRHFWGDCPKNQMGYNCRGRDNYRECGPNPGDTTNEK